MRDTSSNLAQPHAHFPPLCWSCECEHLHVARPSRISVCRPFSFASRVPGTFPSNIQREAAAITRRAQISRLSTESRNCLRAALDFPARIVSRDRSRSMSAAPRVTRHRCVDRLITPRHFWQPRPGLALEEGDMSAPDSHIQTSHYPNYFPKILFIRHSSCTFYISRKNYCQSSWSDVTFGSVC